MKNSGYIKIVLMFITLLILCCITTTVKAQTDYEGSYIFNAITQGQEWDAPDFIALSKYDGDQITVYRQRTNSFGQTDNWVAVSSGVFERGWGQPGYNDKNKGERITFLSANKFTYLNTWKGIKATYIRGTLK